MGDNRDKKSERFNFSFSDQIYSYISRHSFIVGNIKSPHSLILKGRVKGNLYVSGDLYLGGNAAVCGDIYANSLILEGKVFGNISTKGLVNLKASSLVDGDISASNIITEDKVIISGQLSVGNPNGQAQEAAFDFNAIVYSSEVVKQTADLQPVIIVSEKMQIGLKTYHRSKEKPTVRKTPKDQKESFNSVNEKDLDLFSDNENFWS